MWGDFYASVSLPQHHQRENLYMKYRKLHATTRTVLVMLFLTFNCHGQPAFVTDGLIAHYQFEGNYLDSSKNSNHAELADIQKSAGFEVDRFDKNQCLIFSDNNAYLITPTLSGFGPTENRPITISAWVKRDTIGNIIGTYIHNEPENCKFFLGLHPQGALLVGSGYNSISSKLDFSFEWMHIVSTLSYNNVDSDGVIYVNGERLTNGRLSWNANNTTTALTIGRVFGNAEDSMFLRGSLDDLRIYNRALSDAEVKSLFDYESSPQNALPRVATATPQIINGFVVGTTITDGGAGYTTAPIITISGGGGTGARAVATVEGGVVTSITILNPGNGYTSTPTLAIASPPFPPRQATGTTEVFNGFVVGVKIVDGGYGYTTPPSVLVVGGGGTGATATATVTDGVVTGITLTSNGSGYTSAPSLQIATPPFDPELLIEVSRVNVRLKVVVGARYQLESSTDMTVWTPTGPSFIAEDAELVQEFVVESPNRYFRIKQVP